jgi:hypothetical protein
MYLLDTDHLVIPQAKTEPDYGRLSKAMNRYSRLDFNLSLVRFHEQMLGANAVSFPQLCMKHDDLHVIVAVSGGSFWRTADACNKLFSRHQAFDTSSTPL